jgi:hypothetical protein
MAEEQGHQKIPWDENTWINDRNRGQNQIKGRTNGETDLKRTT